jgi:Methyltransferase domain
MCKEEELKLMKCNICDGNDFKEINGRPEAMCGKCGAYERTRLMKMEIDRLFPIESRINMRCLHIAPEYGLSAAIRETFKEYVPVDIDVTRYSHIKGISKIDLCDSESLKQFGMFDLILHAHVIEHIPCNYTIALIRLHKLLVNGGHQIFSIPIYGSFYDESLATLDPKEAESRFGQFDHVRRFSANDIQKTIGHIFNIQRDPSLLDIYSEIDLKNNNIPTSAYFGYSGDYCFTPNDSDLLV